MPVSVQQEVVDNDIHDGAQKLQITIVTNYYARHHCNKKAYGV